MSTIGVRLLILAGALVVLSGCAQLTIRQYTYQGDPARGLTTRVAIAQGIKKGIENKLGYAYAYAGGEEWRWAEPKRPSPTPPADDRGYHNRDYLDAEIARLFEFAARVERLSTPAEPARAGAVREARADAARMKQVLKFDGFDQIALADEQEWREINPVEVFGGFGKTEYIIVRDDGGNYELKSGNFDPSKVIATGVGTLAGALKAFAMASGVPVGGLAPTSAGSPAAPVAAFDPNTSPSLEPGTRLKRDLGRRLDAAADTLRKKLQAVQDAQLSPDVTAPLQGAARTTLVNDLRAAVEGYRSTVQGLSRDVPTLDNLTASLPGASPLDRLASLFSVGSLTDAQVVALFWAYRVNPDSKDPREARLIKDAVDTLVDFDSSGRPAARDGLSAAAVTRTLDDLNPGDKQLKRVRATREKLKDVKNALATLKSYNAMVAELKPVFNTAFANLDQAATDAERKGRAGQLKAKVEKFKSFVDSKPSVTALSEARLPEAQALATKLPASTIAAYDTAFKAVAALPATPTVQDLTALKAKVPDTLLVPVTLPDPEPERIADLNKTEIVTSP